MVRPALKPSTSTPWGVSKLSRATGGATWQVTENAFDMNGIAGTLPQKGNIRVNGLPRIAVDNSHGPRRGWIYIVTNEQNLPPAGSDPDIILHRSTDGGQTWSPGIRVNQDPLNNGKIQYFPAIHVDDGGGVNVLFYDDRTTTGDSTGVFIARSIDGGDTWVEVEISDHHFKPVPIGGLGQGYQGDNIGLTSVGNILWPVWMDNSTGVYQVWTAPTEISAVGIEGRNERTPTGFVLEANYPNPFNPVTNVAFGIQNSEWITLKVYDLSGREVKTLVNRRLPAGYHTVQWDGTNEFGQPVAGGVYLYRLRVGKRFVHTRKMVLLR